MKVWKMIFLFKRLLFGFHVNFFGGVDLVSRFEGCDWMIDFPFEHHDIFLRRFHSSFQNQDNFG